MAVVIVVTIIVPFNPGCGSSRQFLITPRQAIATAPLLSSYILGSDQSSLILDKFEIAI